jgi:hypothetical protein
MLENHENLTAKNGGRPRHFQYLKKNTEFFLTFLTAKKVKFTFQPTNERVAKNKQNTMFWAFNLILSM